MDSGLTISIVELNASLMVVSAVYNSLVVLVTSFRLKQAPNVVHTLS